MGTFSSIHRYHESGEDANVNNVSNFGEPAYSLFSNTKVFTLHHEMAITNNAGEVVYSSRSKVISLHDKTDIVDRTGAQVAHIERKLISLHERHFIDMAGGVSFELSNEILHIFKDISNIEGLGWKLKGNILGLNFELYDGAGNILAVIGQKMLSIHDKYCIDIYQPQYEKEIVAILVTLQHMIKDREAAASSSSSSN